MLSTADGTAISTVTRQIGSIAKKIVAPSVVGAYNKGMQGVDRHDQLRHLFSLARRHHFRKYYMTLILALIDFAVVNANIHYHMRNSELKKNKEHRAVFIQELCEGLRSADWHKLQSEQTMNLSSVSCDAPNPVREILGVTSQ